MDTAFVFPGMGPSRFPEVGRFMVGNPIARRLLRRADEVLGYSVVDRFADADTDYDEAAQVAFLVNCLALAEWAQQHLDEVPAVCTGASFGQKTVAGYTGALSFEDTVLLTARLARVLDDYFRTEHTDIVTQSFVRVPDDRLEPVLAELTARGEWYEFACHLDAGFHMVNLRQSAVDWFVTRLRSVGGLPLYAMRPPMHSSLFTGLHATVRDEILPEFTFADPAVPIVSDQTGELLTTADQVRTLVLDGFVRPVRWPDAVATLRDRSVGKVLVVGQDAMFGRVECVVRSFEVVAVNPRLAMQPRRQPVPAGR
ncbi:ACP S-malonyltransferase [Micromonospora echinofusca]|nr:ACP S-malonyltransferase [Micromonospora echinofusca]